jgi:Ca-activated chloride channel family protein
MDVLAIPGTPFAFAHPLLLVVSLVLVAVWAMWTRRAPASVWEHSVAATLAGQRGWRMRLAQLQPVLRWTGFVLLCVVLGRPQVDAFEEDIVEGIDLFIALDMSGSMLAVDMSPAEIEAFQLTQNAEPPNRFNIAVATLQTLVASRENDRIGMVVFARDAFLQFPLTLDYNTIIALLGQLRMEQIDPNATAIGNAIGLSVRGLMDSEASSRAVILITDGKQQGGNISPVQAADLASEEGIRIYPILVGREGTTMAPSGLRLRSGFNVYRQEMYPVDPELLSTIATNTGGEFYRAENQQELERGLGSILDALETTVLQEVSSVRRNEAFAPLLALALALLLLDVLMAWVFVRRFP